MPGLAVTYAGWRESGNHFQGMKQGLQLMKNKIDLERKRERFDAELALTNDLYQAANLIACRFGWRVACRALYYVLTRICESRGRKQLAEFLDDDSAGWAR